ncbi:Putative Cellobiose dehydrogenase [[Torrubiella] hemipterigena]|uniref:Putative Cellobiose dehydrogenase n=1 Tax=[Torrubiella] hemipterigena TaxID=1531966 RepID=A0A0A1TDK7_9HYPO|nr:Putative Cellobiose dehydrogenase [[Torrubiella] hemipterigena]
MLKYCYLLFFYLFTLCSAEPAQFCKYGYGDNQVDFCSGFTLHRNESTNEHNVYVTFTHTRPMKSAKGWSAIGFGEEMKGSLMVIVYGDPASGKSPIVSVRASKGHSQPTLVKKNDFGGGDLRVLSSSWKMNDSPAGTVTAMVSLVCYSCTKWPGTTIAAKTTSQPLIWAWNAVQEFDTFTYDVHLKMHKHHAGNGGWGRFYVNMEHATSKVPHLPSVPFIRPGVTMYAASEDPDILANGILNAMKKWTLNNRALHIHGALMAAAFLLFIPSGVLAMRSGSPKSFKYHWIIQLTAAITILGGMGVGLTLQKKINTAHQIIGLTIVGLLFVQSYLGYKHHMDFIKIHKRTWISHSHIWTGRGVMIAASGNLLLGMSMTGYPRAIMSMAAVFIVLELCGLSFYVWRRGKIAARRRDETEEAAQSLQSHRYFTISEDTDEEASDTEEKDI